MGYGLRASATGQSAPIRRSGRSPKPVARSLLAALLVGCFNLPPDSFSAGKVWTFPLVDPLRDSKLMTTMMVDGRGPFLVALDPEAKQTTVDREVVSDNWGEKVKSPADLSNVVIGDLTVATLQVLVDDRDGKLDAEGRRVFGVIGRDVLTGALAFGFDRDRGIAWLSRTGEVESSHATPLHFRVDHDRRIVDATIGGKPVAFGLELGEVESQLRHALWDAMGLRASTTVGVMVDHTGVRRDITELGIAGELRVDATARDGLGFVAYDGSDGDGLLGLDFFRPFVVTASWPNKVLYIAKRSGSDGDVTARLGRWGRQLLDACSSPGCVRLQLVRHERDDGSERVDLTRRGVRGWLADLTAGPPATFTLQATRDQISAGNDLQVVISANGSDGSLLPRIEVDLPGAAETATAPADARYDGATFTLVDVSPFPRFCGRGVSGCIMIEAPAAP